MPSIGLLLKKFNKKVSVLQYYRNDLRMVKASGLYQKEVESSPDGQIEHRYLYLLFKTSVLPFKWKLLKIPTQAQKAFSVLEGQEHITLLQVDQNTFYPVVFKEGVINAVVEAQAPVLDMNAPILDEDGNQKINDKGEPLFNSKKDEKGEPVFEVKTEERVIFDSRFVNKDGKLVSLPLGVAAETYNNVEWLGTELVAANRRYKKTGFWNVLKDNAMLIFTIFTCIILIWINWDGLAKLAAQQSDMLTQMQQISRNVGMTGLTPPP